MGIPSHEMGNILDEGSSGLKRYVRSIRANLNHEHKPDSALKGSIWSLKGVYGPKRENTDLNGSIRP